MKKAFLAPVGAALFLAGPFIPLQVVPGAASVEGAELLAQAPIDRDRFIREQRNRDAVEFRRQKNIAAKAAERERAAKNDAERAAARARKEKAERDAWEARERWKTPLEPIPGRR